MLEARLTETVVPGRPGYSREQVHALGGAAGRTPNRVEKSGIDHVSGVPERGSPELRPSRLPGSNLDLVVCGDLRFRRVDEWRRDVIMEGLQAPGVADPQQLDK